MIEAKKMMSLETFNKIVPNREQYHAEPLTPAEYQLLAGKEAPKLIYKAVSDKETIYIRRLNSRTHRPLVQVKPRI